MTKDNQRNKKKKKKYANKNYVKNNNYNKKQQTNKKNNSNVKKILINDDYVELKQKNNKIVNPKIKTNAKNSLNNQKKKELVNDDYIELNHEGNKIENTKLQTKSNNQNKKTLINDDYINQKNNKEENSNKDINVKEISNNKKEIVLIKKKNKYIVALSLIFFICFLAIIVFATSLYSEIQKQLKSDQIKKSQQEIVEKIKDHYNEYVKVANDTILYKKDENNNYYEYGVIYEGTEVILDKIEIDYLTEYFYSLDLECYIKYSDLLPIDNVKMYDNRYKNYIVFNQNIVTKDNFSLYDSENSKKVYTFEKSMSFPIIIKNDNDKYYVEFNNRLLYVFKDDIKEVINVNNTKLRNASKVTTLCYHRIYDSNNKCNDLYICKSKDNFEREMKYLSDNKFFTLTMNEMYLYLTKKIQVPQKSVVLTFDDGTLFELGIEILEKYNLNGTGFIKTGTFSDYTVYESPNFELQSHTDKMHVAGTCPIERVNQQGGGILCLSENTVLNDLKLSREKLNGAIALAYPFYDYNNRAIGLVEKAGFKLAFIGANNVGGRAWPGINLYKIPRMTIWNTTSFDTFKGYVNN